MPDIVITAANLDAPGDQNAILHLLNAYARDPMGGGHDLPAHVRDTLIAGLRQHPTSLIFLAWCAEEPVGVAVCFVGFSTFAARPLINIHDLAVLPAYRRQGIGRLLLERVAAQGQALGCCRLTLEVREDNDSAQALYTQMGFGSAAAYGGGTRVWFLEKPL